MDLDILRVVVLVVNGAVGSGERVSARPHSGGGDRLRPPGVPPHGRAQVQRRQERVSDWRRGTYCGNQAAQQKEALEGAAGAGKSGIATEVKERLLER